MPQGEGATPLDGISLEQLADAAQDHRVTPAVAKHVAQLRLCQGQGGPDARLLSRAVEVGDDEELLGPDRVAGACHRAVPPLPGTGLGRAVAGTVSTRQAVGSGAILLLVSVPLAAAAGAWWAGPLVVLAGWGAAAVTVRHAVHRLGGINGDVLGAAIEIGLAAALAAATLCG